MAKKQALVYQDGDFVVYPTHGVGKILGTETTGWSIYQAFDHPFRAGQNDIACAA